MATATVAWLREGRGRQTLYSGSNYSYAVESRSGGRGRVSLRAQGLGCVPGSEDQSSNLRPKLSPFSPAAFRQYAQHPFHRT